MKLVVLQRKQFEPLFAAVYADPAGDAPRWVLSDALSEAGDPYGEFIALQLRNTAIGKRRAQKLLERHRWDFLGALASVTVADPRDRWARGFPKVVAVKQPPPGAAALIEWATIEELIVFPSPSPPTFLASANFRSLRKVRLGAVSILSRRPSLIREFHAQMKNVLEKAGRGQLFE